MIPNPSSRSEFANNQYARRAPFSHVIDIESMEGLRPGVRIPESGMLGTLTFFPSGDTKMEAELPYAFHEMLERASRLVVRPVEVTMQDTTRTVYIVVAEDESDEKTAAFSQWANHDEQPAPHNADLMRRYQFWKEFFGGDPRRTLGWWAIGYQVAWALSAEVAQQLIDEAFQPPIPIAVEAD